MMTLVAPAGTKSVCHESTTYLVDSKGRVSVPASAIPALLTAGFTYLDPSIGALKAKIATGANANTEFAVAGIGVRDQPICALNLTDLAPLSVAAVKATKASPGAAYDGTLEATTAGAAGNAIRVKFVPDSATAGGVSISRDGTDFTIHYEDTVSTVGTLNTAIGNLGGADDLFGVKTGSEGTVGTKLSGTTEWIPLAGGADAYEPVPTVSSAGNCKLPVTTATKKLLVLYFAV